jgi:hypothetical protein
MQDASRHFIRHDVAAARIFHEDALFVTRALSTRVRFFVADVTGRSNNPVFDLIAASLVRGNPRIGNGVLSDDKSTENTASASTPAVDWRADLRAGICEASRIRRCHTRQFHLFPTRQWRPPRFPHRVVVRHGLAHDRGP